MANINHATQKAHDAQVIAGIDKNMQGVTSIKLLGTAYTTSELGDVFQGHIDALTRADALRAELRAAVTTARAKTKQVAALSRALRNHLVNDNGATSVVLADFGFAPDKVRRTDPITQVVAAERLRATRKARGTRSKKANSKIKGTVPAALAIDTASATVASAEVKKGDSPRGR